MDGDIKSICSMYLKCEKDASHITSMINNFLKDNSDKIKFETEIQEIKEKMRIVERRLIDNKHISNNYKEQVADKLLLEKCLDSLQKLKESAISRGRIEIDGYSSGISEEFHKSNYSEKSVDVSENIFSSAELTDMLEAGQNNGGKVVSSELSLDSRTIEEKNNGNINQKPMGITEKVNAFNGCKHSNGIRIEMFPFLSTDTLDFSFVNRPQIQDSIGRHIQYTPRMVWHNPRADFPSFPLYNFANPSYFDKLALDTLLFIFYFQQGTFQQFLAIQELKKKKWIFHKKCFAWFFKRSESKITTEDAEVADFIYFDFEKDWCQKMKNDFTFEFAHLDNSPIVLNKLNRSCSEKDFFNVNTNISDNITSDNTISN
ncbi:NOT2 / NOT3 / NOT5 family protein [Cryptosporidium felis]|nr:NOT2 / NOT3 / NOT5 family protein [Cryptosporidium felis]